MSLATIRDYQADQWRSTAAEVLGRLETRHFINGAFTDSVEGGRFESVNPATGDVLAEV
ncbi:MAG: hypothetical protein HKO64_07730, partial [Xanthomonadales bacterium]|nr:hypothetical protein [Xanthomonadales bacterium]